MLLRQPFFIGPRLLPALRIGDATLSLDTDYQITEDNRDRATFYLDFADGTSYQDDSLRSGVGGFHNPVEAFDSLLAFMEAAEESVLYEISTGHKGDNADLFPQHVVDWIHENRDEVEMARSDICDECGTPRFELIKED